MVKRASEKYFIGDDKDSAKVSELVTIRLSFSTCKKVVIHVNKPHDLGIKNQFISASRPHSDTEATS